MRIKVFFIVIYVVGLLPVTAFCSEDFKDSAFIDFINKKNQGQVPYPFSKLLDSFGKGLRENGKAILIPNGRSLVKQHADYRDPRIIVNPDADILDEAKPGEIYIGYAPKHDALEVISFNKKTKKYDFFVVENYGKDKTPKVVSNPSLCLSCHQNGGPIFSRFPWSETMGDRSEDFFGFSDKNDLIDKIVEANPDRKEIEGLNIEKIKSEIRNNLKAFDDSVRLSTERLIDSQMCQTLCNEDDVDCKLTLIKAIARPDYFKTKKNLEAFQELDKKIAQIESASSTIPNRNPYTNEGHRTLVNNKETTQYMIFERLYGKKPIHDTTYYELAAIHTSFDKKEIVKDSAFIDPTTKRPPSTSLISQKNSLLKKSLEEKVLGVYSLCPKNESVDQFIKGKNPSEIEEIFKDSQLRGSLTSWPMNPDVLARVIDKQPVEDCVPTDIKVHLPGEIEKLNEATHNQLVEKPSKLFNKYCSECHGPSGFLTLPLDSVEAMANYEPTFSGTGVLGKLEKKVMPPEGALQPSLKERTDLINYVKEYSSKKK